MEHLVVAQLLSHVQLFVTSWTEAYQASLSFSISLRIKGDYVCCLIFFSIVSEKEIAVVVHH